MDQRWKVVPLGAAMVVAAAIALALIVAAMAQAQEVERRAAKPNILFIMADDLDARTLRAAMPNTRNTIGGQGVTFENATYGFPVCCPSRVSIMRGQYPHNTFVYSNEPRLGGYETFRARGLQNDTYATRLNNRGYSMGYVGKVMNGYGGRSARRVQKTVLPGWDFWLGSSNQQSATFITSRRRVVDFRDGSHDAIVAQRGMEFLRNNVAGRTPWMLALNYHGPHVPQNGPESYRKLFRNAPLPKPPSYNERDLSDKPAWLRRQPPIGPEIQRRQTVHHRERLRAARYIDQQNARMLQFLSSRGELRNTYVVFYSDNGFHIGQHRLPGGQQPGSGSKATPYLEDVRFPILMRGPGIEPGQRSGAMVQNVDLRPTFEDIAGAATPSYVDGTSMLPAAASGVAFPRQFAYAESLKRVVAEMPLWKAVYTSNEAYHLWNTGEEEFYDLALDRYQLESNPRDPRVALMRQALVHMQDCDGAECYSAVPAEVEPVEPEEE